MGVSRSRLGFHDFFFEEFAMSSEMGFAISSGCWGRVVRGWSVSGEEMGWVSWVLFGESRGLLRLKHGERMHLFRFDLIHIMDRKRLGKTIGEVLEVLCGPNGMCHGVFMKVRVSVDIRKPLARVIKQYLALNKHLIHKSIWGWKEDGVIGVSVVANSEVLRLRSDVVMDGVGSSHVTLMDVMHGVIKPDLKDDCLSLILAPTNLHEVWVDAVDFDGRCDFPLVVEKVGMSGGLCLFWSSNMDVILKGYSRSHIDVLVCSHFDFWWRYTGLYGQPDASLGQQFWCLLECLVDSYSGPCLMDGFRNAISKCGLDDMGFEGPRFTWCNKHKDGSFLQERLDCALNEWNGKMPAYDKTKKELDVLLYKDEKYWSSRAKNFWLKLGRACGVYAAFRMSRLIFRDLANKGMLNGIKKASW
ncbi:hypothetical protein G4B88_006212 [Cannabis sativa]|uniref:Uncharacterized protein n=1 Tax=Cannabis sativa TaxID=3483 RepID=A0A7J6IC44_CANSA|nr:hypothetical protein G4B88_006212 [Cannabis sativa]